MKCTECSLEDDKYIIFKCDSCDITQCKECGGFTASEEKCFALSKRKVILFCSKCREEMGTIVGLKQKHQTDTSGPVAAKEIRQTSRKKLLVLPTGVGGAKQDIINGLSPLVLHTKTDENTHRNTCKPRVNHWHWRRW
ncbi:hypothetical protein WA026_001077 [Henosepilachna vigintioctopunctata]|uniref:B box-type domain-containing protein n=1 Tax=Henosepilachna vigintioctopunctata TaxID=420089 RepID=A0AAW1V9E5_9CUCU